MLTSQAIEGFVLDLLSGNYATRTVEGYKTNLRHLCDFLGDPEIGTVALDDLKRFMAYLKTDYQPVRMNHSTAPLSGSAQDNHWKAIRTFYRWAEEALQVRNITEKLPRPKYSTPEIIPFSEDEIKTMLSVLDSSRLFKRQNTKEYRLRRPTALRDRAIFLMLLDTGMRIGELCRLEIRDVNLATGEVNIAPFSTGKKTTPRTVYMGKAARRTVWLYVAKLKEYDPKDRLFNVNPTPVRQILKSLEKRSGVRDIHPHRFRHTFAIEFLRNGGDVFTLKRLLGHRSLDMVQHYLAIARSDVENAHRTASPVDKWRL